MALPSYLALLVLTIAIELPLAAGLAPRGARVRTAWSALFLNLATHPPASAAIVYLHAPWLAVEVLVVVAEAVGYVAVAGLTRSRALLVAAVTNAATMLVAVLFWA